MKELFKSNQKFRGKQILELEDKIYLDNEKSQLKDTKDLSTLIFKTYFKNEIIKIFY